MPSIYDPSPMSSRWNAKALRWCVAALVLGAGSAIVPVGARPVAAQPAASGGVVVIANGWSPPDVGAAAPLAGRLDAVVLYSSSDSLGAPTVAALGRLRPARVVLMGGTAALSESVADEVRSVVPGVDLRRLSGADRLDTAAQAALEAPAVPAGRPVVIANGWSPPDVVVAAPLADSLGGSVLFAQKSALGDATAAALRRLRPSQVVIVGGTAALDASIESQIGSAAPGVAAQRLGGAARPDTAGRGAELADVAAGSPVVIASGWSTHDVGAAAPLAAAIDGTVLFSYRSSLGEHTAAMLRRLAPNQVTLVGNTDAIPSAVQAEVAEVLRSATVQRIAGDDRKATAADAALYAAGDASVLVTADEAAEGEVTTSIAAGQNHTCWLQSDGTIACRGEERFGRTDAPAGKFMQISGAQTHNCGLRTDRTIACWGARAMSITDPKVNYGQVDPPTGTFTEIDAGQFHNCAVRTDQTIACWGAEDEVNYGQATAPAGKFTTVEAGWFHTCGIRADQTAVCWGAEDLPILEGASGTPTKAPEGAFEALAAGELHTCGLHTDKTIACWGDDEYGQLAAPKGKFSDLAAGLHFTCGLRIDSTVACWGNNQDGQTEALAGEFELIEAGHYHACGLRSDEPLIECWGSRAELTGPGQHSLSKFSKIQSSTFASCGILASSSEIVCWGRPATRIDGKVQSDLTEGVPRGSFRDLQIEGNAACGLRSNGRIACWGDYLNESPTGTYRSFDLGPHWHQFAVCGIRSDHTLRCHTDNLGPGFWFIKGPHAPAGLYTDVVVTAFFSCALRSDKTVTCWRFSADSASGYVELEAPSGSYSSIGGTSGQVCAISEEHRPTCWIYEDSKLTYFDLSIDDTVSAVPYVKLGSLRCALMTDKSAQCWNREWESSGDGEWILTESYAVEDRFDELSVGQDFACGLRTDHTIRCWGANEYDQSEPPEGEFTAVAAGTWHACGIRKDSGVVCWGDRAGRIVLVNDEGTSSGVDVLPSETPLLSVGNFHNCMVRSDRSVTCWSSGDRYEGLGANAPNESFTAVSAAGEHTCGLTSSGTIACWGPDHANSSGETSPPSGRFTSVEAGFQHSCGVRTNGEVACWGSNYQGQSDAPAGSFVAVSAGQVHSCGLTTNQRIACWGDNRFGQSSPPSGSFLAVSVGDWYACGLTTNHRIVCWGDDRNGRTQAPGGAFTAISAGSAHGCGLRPDGTIDCWGFDDSGRTEAPPGTYIAVSSGAAETCALRSDETVVCWGRVQEGRPTGSR